MFNSEKMEVIALTVLCLISGLIYPDVMNVSGLKSKIGFITCEVRMNVSEDLMNICMKKKES